MEKDTGEDNPVDNLHISVRHGFDENVPPSFQSAEEGLHYHPATGLSVVVPFLPCQEVKSRVSVQQVLVECKSRISDDVVLLPDSATPE